MCLIFLAIDICSSFQVLCLICPQCLISATATGINVTQRNT